MKKLIILTCIIFLNLAANGQFLVNFGIGGTGYQGDISPFGARVSFATDNKLSVHAEAGIQFNEYMNFKVGYLYGKIAASDSKSSTEGRVNRNLSFRSKIHEFSVTSEIDILELFNRANNETIVHPFFKFGIGVFHFNPKASFNGKIVELQPLGTEGQGLNQFPNRKKYSLYQLTIPFGIGVSFDLDDNLRISTQLTPRWTFTDYLDDVSKTYVGYETLMEARGPMAANLADRSSEIGGEKLFEAGNPRGNDGQKDWYFYLGVDLSYNFDMRKVFSVFSKEYRISCF